MRALDHIEKAQVLEPLQTPLADTDWRVREAAAEAVESLGWKPTDDAQRAMFAVAARRWKEAVELGTASVTPVVAHLEDRDIAYQIERERSGRQELLDSLESNVAEAEARLPRIPRFSGDETLKWLPTVFGN